MRISLKKNYMDFSNSYTGFVTYSLLLTSLLGVPVKCEWQVPKPTSIIGGNVISTKNHGFHVSIFNVNLQHLCSGVIVEPYWILTSANCIRFYTSEDIFIRVGSDDLTGGTVYPVKRIFTHGSFDVHSKIYDFALLLSASPLKKKIMRFSSLPAAPGEMGIVSGWGADPGKKNPKLALQVLNATVLNVKECRKKHPNLVFDSMMCVEVQGKTDYNPCDFAPGDPIVSATSAGGRTLMGLFISLKNCTSSNHPPIFSDIAYAYAWMQYVFLLRSHV